MSSKGRLNIVNRDEYSMFQESPVLDYPVKAKIKAVKFVRIDHDAKYNAMKEAGVQIDITNPEDYVNKRKAIDGIHSPLFGADTTADAPVYSCDCRELVGGMHAGHICPKCNTMCRPIDADLRITGYIDIAPYHIMSYHGYINFCKIFKAKVVEEIIHSVKKINVRGKIVDDGILTIQDLYDRYEEWEDAMGIPRNIAFMSKIPVYSSRLRPLFHFGSRMEVLDVNKAYKTILRCREALVTTPLFRVSKGASTQTLLNEIQQEMNTIYKLVSNKVDTKNGVYRQSLASGRVDYTSRMVIALGTDLMAHEIDIPYTTAMIIYEEEISNYLCKTKGISLSRAISMVEENAMERNEEFVNYINQFLKSKGGVWTWINRNPTISEHGIMYVRIRKVHDDPTDMTMHVSADVLEMLGADFDGDQLTNGANKDIIFHKYFLTMCPTYAFIDRSNGRYNQAMSFKKDYAALLSAGWEIDHAFDRYLLNPEEDSYEVLNKMGLISASEDESHEIRDAIIKKMIKLTPEYNIRNRFIPDYIND